MNTLLTPLEPTRARLANPLVRYLLATRPAFLTITLAGCLLGYVLYINQFPDRHADRASGKLHWVARLQPQTAAWGYALILMLAALALLGDVLSDALPLVAACALVAWIPAVQAWRQLRRFAAIPGQLTPAIKLTLLAAHVLPLLLATILLLSGDFL